MVGAAAAMPLFTLAPVGETLADAKRRRVGHSGVKTVVLSAREPVPDYSGGNRTIRIDVTKFSYQGKSLLGSYTTKLTQQGVSSPDKETENDLIRDTAARAFEKFTANAARLP